jgi:hypothetical protein
MARAKDLFEVAGLPCAARVAATVAPSIDMGGEVSPAAMLFSRDIIDYVTANSTARDGKAARSLIGKWRGMAKGDAKVVLDALTRARRDLVLDLSAWMPKAMGAALKPKSAPAEIVPAAGECDRFGRAPSHPFYGSPYAA